MSQNGEKSENKEEKGGQNWRQNIRRQEQKKQYK